MQQPQSSPFTLFIRPEIGPPTPMELNYREILSHVLRCNMAGQQAKIDPVVRRIDHRINVDGSGAVAPENDATETPARLHSERSQAGLLAILHFLSPGNRADGIVLSVPGRIACAVGSDPRLDAEIGLWFTRETAALSREMTQSIAVASAAAAEVYRDEREVSRNASDHLILESQSADHAQEDMSARRDDDTGTGALRGTLGPLDYKQCGAIAPRR